MYAYEFTVRQHHKSVELFFTSVRLGTLEIPLWIFRVQILERDCGYIWLINRDVYVLWIQILDKGNHAAVSCEDWSEYMDCQMRLISYEHSYSRVT
jgi:hypothetical protein